MSGGQVNDDAPSVQSRRCMQQRPSKNEARTLELPVFLSMTRLKAFKLPKGSSSSLTCRRFQKSSAGSSCKVAKSSQLTCISFLMALKQIP